MKFIESIKVLDGVFYNLPLHEARFMQTVKLFCGLDLPLNLNNEMIPADKRHGLFKCRIIYSSAIESISFEPYTFRTIESLALVECNTINYKFKTELREQLDVLRLNKGTCSDVLIVKDGYLTDTSFSNVVLENDKGLFTPHSYLLSGTKRQLLLNKGVIKEADIKPTDLCNYSRLYIVNALIDLEDNISLPTTHVIW